MRKFNLISLLLVLFGLGIVLHAFWGGRGRGLPRLEEDIHEDTGLYIRAPHYTSTEGADTKWELWADSAQFFDNRDLLVLSNVKVEMATSGQERFTLTGREGRVDTISHSMELIGDIRGSSQSGYRLSTEVLKYSGEKREVYAEEAISFWGPQFRLNTKGLMIALEDQSLEASGQVEGELFPRAEGQSSSPPSPFWNQLKEPLKITSWRMMANMQQNWVRFIGEVKASSGDYTIWADEIKVLYLPAGLAQRQAGRRGQREDWNISQIVASGNVRFEQGDIEATGERATLEYGKKELTLTGNPVIKQGKNWVSGDRIQILLDEKEFVIEGQAEMLMYPKEMPGGGKTKK